MKDKRGQMQMAPKPTVKKSRWWIWLIVVLVLVGIGVGAWILFGWNGGIIGGSSIPLPPALPS